MKFKKYMLVPVEPESKPVQIKETMRTVLKSGRKDHGTAKKYSHLLHDYLHYKKDKPKKLDVMKHIPSIYHNKVKQLLKDTHITWTPLGELKDQLGKPIYGSHIVDLFKEAFIGNRKKRAPPGWDSFIQQISVLPLSFFTKQSTKKDIEKLKWRTFE